MGAIDTTRPRIEQLSRFRTAGAMCRLFTAPRRNAATALMLAAMAAPALTERALAGPADSEIRIGNTMPYTGPASAYGVIGKVMAAYFDKINAEGGIRGRKINFISYDDAYNPTKTMEATRKLVEEDNVLFLLASLGTNTSQAVHPYLNAKQIPQLFVASGATMWDQPREFPWTMGFLPSYQTEAHIYSQYLLENHPRSKVAVLYQDDGFGKDYLKGLKDGLGGKIPIVAEASYKVTDTSIDAQIAKLKASGADIFMQFTTPKFATMAIKRNAELGWKPVHFLASVSESVSAVMAPAGVENAEGIMSAMYRVEGEDAQTAGPAAFREWSAFMERYVPSVSKSNGQAVYGYLNSKLIIEILKNCGDDFSRENIMKQARSIKGLQLPMMVPGIQINTSPYDHATIEQMRIMPVMGRGSVQAVSDILLLRGVDAGIVRKDTLSYLDRKDFAKDIRNQFVYVAKMFNEEMHVLAPKTITSIRDLDGKTVVVDLPDSSTFVTAINVFDRLGIRPHLIYQEPRLAVDMLRKGEVDAIVAIEGKPLQWLNQIQDRNLHLVPVEYAQPLQEEYLPSKLGSADYPGLVPEGGFVETIAAEAVLASYNWAPNSDRYRRLALLVDTMFDKVGQVQRPPFPPQGKELAPRATVSGWTRFKAAQEWLDRNMPLPAGAAVSAASGAVAPPPDPVAAPAAALAPQDRDPLYREFLEWRAGRAKA